MRGGFPDSVGAPGDEADFALHGGANYRRSAAELAAKRESGACARARACELRNLGIHRHPSTDMRLPRSSIAIVATAALFGGLVFAQDSTVDKPKVADSTQPETARDSPSAGPETARDERKSGPETAGADRSNAPETARDSPASGPETARDPPASGPETAQDDQRSAPETASDRTDTPDTATDAPPVRHVRRTAEAASAPTNR